MKPKVEFVDKPRYTIAYIHTNLVGEDVSQELHNLVIDEMEKRSAKNLVLMLGEVHYMSSAGVALMVKLLTKVRVNGGELYLTDVRESVHNLLVITKLENIFKLLPNLESVEELLG